MSKPVVVAVAWPYVNGDIHIGHLAGYLLPADAFARFHRLLGNEVLMVSGSDCFGTPITVEADKRGISPQALIAEYHPKAVELFTQLGLSFDNYTKTDTANHRAVVQQFFLGMLNQGLITKGTTKQYYSPQENRFLPDRYVEGQCPICKAEKARSDQCDACGSPLAEGQLINPMSRNTNTPAELRPTEHYFIDWPKIQPFLQQYFDGHAESWRPWIRSETLKWLKEGLQPRAITRDLQWGVELPVEQISAEMQIDNPGSKRLYVWFDAVIGYLSASIEWATQKPGRSWEHFWKNPEAHHAYFMGKDNLVFHTLFWPGQLHSYDSSLNLPDFPAVNQFLTLEGQKFSKSRGVTVDSKELVTSHGLDAVRFYIATISPEHADANFIWEEFISRTNAVLNGNIGNFINRSLKLSESLTFGAVTEISAPVVAAVNEHLAAAHRQMSAGSLREYINTTIELSAVANKFISDQAPWKIKDRTDPAFAAIMNDCLYYILALQLLLTPVIPETAQKLAAQLGVGIVKWPKDTLAELLTALRRVKINDPKPLFSRIDRAGVVVATPKG